MLKLKQILSIVSLAVFSLTLCSCSGDNDGTVSNDSTSSDVIENISSAIVYDENYNKVSHSEIELYSDTVLTYVVPSRYPVDTLTANLINYYLNSIGRNYSVKFVGISGAEGYDKASIEYLKTNAVDIMYVDDNIDGYRACEELVQNGELLCLDEYLSSENGAALFSSLPKSNWSGSKVDGKIFGATGYPFQRVSPPSYKINKALMEKYGYTVEDLNKPLDELADVFEKVRQGEGEDFYPLYISGAANISDIKRLIGSSNVGINRKTYKAELITDNEAYRSIAAAIDSYMGIYISEELTSRDMAQCLMTFSYTTQMPTYYVDWGECKYNGESATEDEVIVLPLDEELGWYERCSVPSCLTSISAKSENQELALDFLSLIYTDRKITDYLLFGCEGVNYTLIDGKVNPILTELCDFNRWLIYGNSYICTPRDFEYTNKEEIYYAEAAKLQEDIFADFYPVVDEEAVKLADRLFEDESIDRTEIDNMLADLQLQIDEYLNNNKEDT